MFVDEFTEISLGPRNITKFRDLGYQCSIGDKLKVKTSELPKESDFRVRVQCIDCGLTREVKFSQASELCRKCADKRNKFKPGKEHTNWKGGNGRFRCKECGKLISRRKDYDLCRTCFGKKNSGENHYRWRSDRENIVVRNGNMQRWAMKVKETASFKCDICGKKEVDSAVAHRLEGVSVNRDAMYLMDNGVCLCNDCHKEFHRDYGYGCNTEKQYLEFKGGYYAPL